MKIAKLLGIVAFLVGLPSYANAATVTYTNQANFEAALGSDFKLLDLDSQPTADFVNDLDMSGLNASFFGPNAALLSGRNGETEGDNDIAILNGAGFNGSSTPSIGLNFAVGSNGIGAFSNFIDGGRIQLFSEQNGQGDLIAEVGFGGGNINGGNFGGITTDAIFQSAIVTCDFNADLRCGVYDIQYSSFDEPESVPEPAFSFGILVLAASGSLAIKRRSSINRGN